MFAIVVTGPPGAGKTSVPERSDQLAEDVRHAMIDIEALTATPPALDEDRWLAQAAWRRGREAGAPHHRA